MLCCKAKLPSIPILLLCNDNNVYRYPLVQPSYLRMNNEILWHRTQHGLHLKNRMNSDARQGWSISVSYKILAMSLIDKSGESLVSNKGVEHIYVLGKNSIATTEIDISQSSASSWWLSQNLCSYDFHLEAT